MLTSIEIDGLKVSPLRTFTVLIGQSCEGKTTLMEAVGLLGRLVAGSIRELPPAVERPHLRSATNSISITARLRLRDRVVVWEVGLGARRCHGISDERVTVLPHGADGNEGQVVLERSGREMSRTDVAGVTDTITQTLTSSWLSVVTDDDEQRFPWLVALANWARAIHGRFCVDPDGGNLASFLYGLHKQDRAAIARVQKRVQRHYPQLVGIASKSDRGGWTRLEITERWNGETATFNARQVSSGLLQLIMIATMHELPSRPSVLLLADVENGVHPHLLEGVVGMLQELVEKRATQVILATHSPIALSFCDPEDVILFTRGPHGHATCMPLSATTTSARFAETFSAGELWYNIGEDKLTR